MKPVSDAQHSVVPLAIQWHLTSRCNNRCKHCYMYAPETAASELSDELNINEIIAILEDLAVFEQKHGYRFKRFHLTGGDPLLREDWVEIVEELRGRGRIVEMMGNPDTLTEGNVRKVVELGISKFQISLDGLPETHDGIRGKGSFALTVQKIALLRQHGILVNVMFTLFKENAHDLVPLLEYVAVRTEATSFSFDLGCSIGGAAENALEDVSPNEVAKLLDAYDRSSRTVARPGFRIHEKSNLHRLRKYIQGEYLPAVPDSCTRIAGCLAGWTGLCLLSNGAALACRRLPIIVGKMPEQSFEELFLSSEIMKKFRRHEYFGTCGHCLLYSVCRGCPAAAFGATGDAFAECPHCFKPQNQRSREVHKRLIASPPLETSPEEESVFIKQNRTYLDNYDGYLRRRAFQDAFFPLVHTANAVKEFLECPDSYLDNRALSLDGDEIAWLAFYVSEGGVSIRYDQRSLKRTSRLRRHESVKPTLAIEPDRIAIELKDRTISMDAGARTIVEKLFSHDSFTAADVLQWDRDFDWREVKAFLHVMLEELIICYADR